MKFEVQCEPSFLALGPYHFAVGMNNRAWIYAIGIFGGGASVWCYVCTVGDETHEVERSFLGSITGFSLNGEYFACLFGGKLHLMQVCMQHTGHTFCML